MERQNRKEPWLCELSASIGVYAAVPGMEDGIDEFMTRADREMYADKTRRKQGRRE
jgi:GGDEF domain-containing protein